MKNDQINRGEVLRMAWAIIRKTKQSFGDSLKQAWAAFRAKIKLATTDERGLWLKFQKKDGSIRDVLATRNLMHIPAEDHPKNHGSGDSHTVSYYDIWAGHWKSFQIVGLISIS